MRSAFGAIKSCCFSSRSRFLFSARSSSSTYHGHRKINTDSLRRAPKHKHVCSVHLLPVCLGDHLHCASLACDDANSSQIVNSAAYMRVRRADGRRPRRRGCFRACAAPQWRNSQTQGLWEFAFVHTALTPEEGIPEFRPGALIVSLRARRQEVRLGGRMRPERCR